MTDPAMNVSAKIPGKTEKKVFPGIFCVKEKFDGTSR